jgi:fibronectin-binding autotransporter adhesin
MSALTFSTNLISSGDTVYTAAETAAAGDDLTVNAGVSLSWTSGSLALAAGDNVVIHGHVTAGIAVKSLVITAGAGDLDNSGAITVDGVVGAGTILTLAALDGITLSGNGALVTPVLDLSAGAGVSEAGTSSITANRLQSTTGITGDVTLTSASNAIRAVGGVAVTGNLTLIESVATLTLNGPIAVTGDLALVDQSGGAIVHAGSNTQTLDTSGIGNFTLSFNGQTTTTLAAGASAAQVQAALMSLTTIFNIGGSVAVSQSGSSYAITFGGQLAGTALPLITASGSSGNATAVAGATPISARNVELIADQIDLGADSITATDTITLAPATAGTSMVFGSELTHLSAPTLTIGRDSAGHVTAGAISFAGNNVLAASTLNIVSTAGVTLSARIVAGAINVTAGGTVFLGDDNHPGGPAVLVGAISGSTSSGDFLVCKGGAVPLAVNGITTAGGEIVLYDPIDTANINGALASHGGNVLVSVGSGGRSAAIVINADIDAGSGAIGLAAYGSMTESGGSVIGHDLQAESIVPGNITLTSAANAISGRVWFSASNVSFTNSSAYMIGGFAGIDYASTGVTHSRVNHPTWAIYTGSLTLTAGGDISQDGGVNEAVRAVTLNLARVGAANPNVTLDHAGNTITNLGSVDLASGALTLVDAVGLTMTGTVTAGALTLTAPTLTLAGGAITTVGAQTYHGAVTLGAATTLTSHNGGITVDSALDNGGFDLTVSVTGAGTFAGVIAGSGNFIKDGAGRLTLVDTETYTGATTIAGGTLLVDGALASAITTVANGGTLGGHGAVDAVIVASGGALAPGDSPGVLTTGDVALTSGAHLAIELGGLTPGLNDQLQVHGTVDLGQATLDAVLVNGFAPAVGDAFVLIDNDGTDAVTGTFLGLSEGAVVAVNGVAFSISYLGGDGNDVVLTALQNHAPVNTVPPAQSVAADSDLTISGLAIADADAAAGILTTTLAVAHGTLQLAVGHAAIAGNGSASVTLTGTLAEIDATLASVTYRAQAGFGGADTLTMTTSDNGNTGLGGALTDTDTMAITVTSPRPQDPNDPQNPLAPVDDSFTAPGGAAIFVGGRGVDTVTFNFRLVDATVTYVGSDIIIDGPNGTSHTMLSGIETFVFTDGTVNNRDGNPLVDDLFYYSRNHDVWNAHVDADTHFNTFGWREGRDPNAWFDTKDYLAQYTDVAAAGVNPLTHYDQNGWREGRDPSVAFDTGDYLAHNADVAAAHVDPLAHFLAWGGEEGRQPFNDGVWG